MTTALRHRGQRAVHLVDGFVRAIWPAKVSVADDDWVRHVLTPAEYRSWSSMPQLDRREGLRTAKRLMGELGQNVESVVVAAALLHDVGKSRSGLGAVSRACATVVAAVVPERVERWRNAPAGWRRRIHTYAHHAEEGERVLRQAGARGEVVEWAGAHHTPADWAGLGFPIGVARALARADGEPVGER